MQALHVIWSAGATLGPFVIRPFLVPLPPSVNVTSSALPMQSTSFLDGSSTFLSSACSFTAQQTFGNDSVTAGVTDFPVTTQSIDSTPDVAVVRHAFLIIAFIGLVPVACFLFAYFCLTTRKCRSEKPKKPAENDEHGEEIVQHRNSGRLFYLSILVVLSLFYCSYLWIEMIPGTLLGIFVVDGLGWEATVVSSVMSTFWGFHCLGRLIGVPLSMVLSPAKMITANIVVIFLASCLMYVGTQSRDIFIWISIAALALGMASTFAAGVLLADQHIHFRGVAASVVIIAASIGGATGTPLTGMLLDKYGPMAFVYILLITTLVVAIFFIFLIILLTIYDNKKKKFSAKTNKSLLKKPNEENESRLQEITSA